MNEMEENLINCLKSLSLFNVDVDEDEAWLDELMTDEESMTLIINLSFRDPH